MRLQRSPFWHALLLLVLTPALSHGNQDEGVSGRHKRQLISIGDDGIKLNLPHFELPEFKLPEFALPELKMPDFNFPDLSQMLSRRNDRYRRCTTPDGNPGFCQNLSACPQLVFDLNTLRRSICFQDLFIPGVCCPDPTQTTTTTVSTTSSTTTTTQSTPTSSTTATTSTIQQVSSSSTPEQATSATFIDESLIQNVTEDYRCGAKKIPEYRIIGGIESYRGKWPWMAAIFLHGPRRKVFHCGGTIISERYVMTAAHCTKDPIGKTFHSRQFTVRVGDHNIYNNGDDQISDAKTHNVEEIVVHPDFIQATFSNDVALLKLTEKIDFSKYVIPVCLPSDYLAGLPLDALAGQYATVTGYGRTSFDGQESPTLRETRLPIWRNQDCDSRYFQPITRIYLCAGLYAGGKDACQGDSGGPLQLFIEDRWVQVGIVSFGDECALPNVPGVYTRISEFTNWIDSIIRR